MKTFVCSLFNSSTGHFSPPLVFDTKEQALNTFVQEVFAKDSELFNIKNQLSLFIVGRFDHKAGKLESYLFKKCLIKGSELVEDKPMDRTPSNVSDIKTQLQSQSDSTL